MSFCTSVTVKNIYKKKKKNTLTKITSVRVCKQNHKLIREKTIQIYGSSAKPLNVSMSLSSMPSRSSYYWKLVGWFVAKGTASTFCLNITFHLINVTAVQDKSFVCSLLKFSWFRKPYCKKIQVKAIVK